MVLSSEERVFLVKYVFREGNRYTDLVHEQFAEKSPGTTLPHLQKVFANKIKGVHACIDARERHFNTFVRAQRLSESSVVRCLCCDHIHL
jgi:hypothetical protein